MAYSPTTWATGDTVTATKMNKIEQGIANAGSALIVSSSYVNGAETMNKTVQEIYDALTNGVPVYYAYRYGNPSTDYVAYAWLAPIITIYTYGYADMIRIAVSNSKYRYQDITSIGNAMSPTVMTFQASGMNSYPTFYAVEMTAAANSTRSTSFGIS